MPLRKAENQQKILAASGRKPYVAPIVVEYGSLSDITLTIGKNGLSDGGTNINGKNFTRT